MHIISNKQLYLERMSKPLQEKLKIINYFPQHATQILDVGCADGTITIALAKLFPEIQFLGIDLDQEFIDIAKERGREVPNVRFEKIYLRDLLARPERFDSVTFCSVLHEFYSYGEGISSVLKAVADAHELLHKDGTIVIRDMILSEYSKKSTLYASDILQKINATEFKQQIESFEKHFGKLNNRYKLNHFLLKYWYDDNWDREVKEHYVPVTYEQYENIFSLLGMTIQHKHAYLIPFLKEKWQEDFQLKDAEIDGMLSTGIITAYKHN